MLLSDVKHRLAPELYEALEKEGIKELRPCQEKAIDAGLLSGENLVICTPTASGKTMVGELAALNAVFKNKAKAVYIVPLVALANEKHKEFKKRYGNKAKIAISVGDFDNSDSNLIDYDVIVCTAEKLDSLMRHHAPWLSLVKVVIIDEIHLLNDHSRGPTLEIVLTMLKRIIPGAQVVGLSATIGNPGELADWLKAEPILDSWRPVPLKKGVFVNGKFEF
jgi:helicase